MCSPFSITSKINMTICVKSLFIDEILVPLLRAWLNFWRQSSFFFIGHFIFFCRHHPFDLLELFLWGRMDLILKFMLGIRLSRASENLKILKRTKRRYPIFRIPFFFVLDDWNAQKPWFFLERNVLFQKDFSTRLRC